MKKNVEKSSQTQTVISFDAVYNKFNSSTATVEELRLALFAPIEKFSHNSKTVLQMKEKKEIVRKTNWGTVKIKKTLLSQNHRDLLDCILTYGEFHSLDGENTIGYRFSLNSILKKMYGEDKKTRNTKVITDLLEDMLSSVISIEPNNGDFAKFQIFSFSGYLEEIKDYYIKFNPEYVRFFSKSLTIEYKNILDEIILIKEPIIKAIIRLALTQKESLTMKVYDPSAEIGKSGILEAIGYPIESDAMKKRAFKILKDNQETLKKYGIYYDSEQKNKTIKYRKNQKIKFIPPTTNAILDSLGENEKDKYVELEIFINKKFKFKEVVYRIEEIFLDENKKVIILKSKNLINDEIREIELPKPSEAYLFLEKLINNDIKG